MRSVEYNFVFVVAGSYYNESSNEESFSPTHCFLSKGVLNTQFIEEYLELGHMEEVVNIDEITSEDEFFLSHHGVVRSGNRARTLRSCSYLRVVFYKTCST
ncbi:hypothetical protein NPIL_662381 [Nephila pilipes]|uniref:Uncharacterized protein n=1 Tax=Nephila pilipes TaxID=299642 RepID=A0A8X6N711_NEPPI|nr:hypothetical protein NPIL_662381 [Nephila pilipes]